MFWLFEGIGWVVVIRAESIEEAKTRMKHYQWVRGREDEPMPEPIALAMNYGVIYSTLEASK